MIEDYQEGIALTIIPTTEIENMFCDKCGIVCGQGSIRIDFWWHIKYCRMSRDWREWNEIGGYRHENLIVVTEEVFLLN